MQKLLTALLNSKLLFWYAFHGTASFGSDRPAIQQAELLRLPFPAPKDVQQSRRSEEAGVALAAITDAARKSAQDRFTLSSGDDGVFGRLDSLCYTYFGLGDEEISLVEDAVEKVIPCVQPRREASVDLWKPAGRSDRRGLCQHTCSLLEAMVRRRCRHQRRPEGAETKIWRCCDCG